MIGICETQGGDLWFAFLDKTVGAEDGGGLYFNNDKQEEREGIGSSWSQLNGRVSLVVQIDEESTRIFGFHWTTPSRR